MLQQARSELERTSDQLEEALKSNPDRTGEEVARLKKSLEDPMIKRPATHTALFSTDDAMKAGLPVIKADPARRQWQTHMADVGQVLRARFEALQRYLRKRPGSQIGAREDGG